MNNKMYKIFRLWKTFHLSTTTFHRLSTKNREIYTAKKPLFSRRKRFFEGYMHKSTAPIIITIILYISFKINICFLRENSRGAVLTKKIVRNQPENGNCENQEKIFSYKRFLLAKTYGLW